MGFADRNTVLITGASGFVGKGLAQHLRTHGFEVLGVTRDPEGMRVTAAGMPITWVRWEEITPHSLANTFAIVHLSTCYGRTESEEEVHEANVTKPLSLMSAALDARIPVFINTDTYFSKLSDEYSYLKSYRNSKKAFSLAAQELCAKYPDTHLVDFRLEHPFGQHEPRGKFCSDVLHTFIENIPTLPCTPGEQVRDFIFLDDVHTAYSTVLSSVDKLASYELIQVGTGVPSRVMDFIEEVKLQTASPTKPVYGALPYRNGELMYSVANNSRLRELGWSPQWSLRSGIAHCLASIVSK